MDNFFDFGWLNSAFSMGPFITCFLTISILFIYIHVAIYNSKYTFQSGVKAAFIIVTIIMLRMLIPINFPFTYSIYFKNILMKIGDILYYHFHFFGRIIMPSDILFGIWIIVSLILLARFIARSISVRSVLKKYILNEEDSEVYKRFIKKSGIHSLRIAVTPEKTASIFGVIRPILILPQKGILEEDLKFIILHELEHYRHHDLWIKFLLDVLSCFHWWNPCIYLLKRDTNLALELCTDQRVIKNSDKREKLDYAESLLRVSKAFATGTNKTVSQVHYDLSLVEKGSLQIRVQRLLDAKRTKRHTLFNGVQTLFLISLLMFSMFIVFEPASHEIPEEVQSDTFSITPDNAYLIKEKGEYHLYVNDEYLSTIDQTSVEESFSDIPIIKEE